MTKVFVLDGTTTNVDFFLQKLSHRVLTTDILGNDFANKAPTILYISESEGFPAKTPSNYRDDFSQNYFSPLREEKGYFSIVTGGSFVHGRERFSVKGVNEIIAALRDKADFLFINSIIFEKHREIGNIDEMLIDGIIDLQDNDYSKSRVQHKNVKNYKFIITETRNYSTTARPNYYVNEFIFDTRKNTKQALINKENKEVDVVVSYGKKNVKATVFRTIEKLNDNDEIMGFFTPASLDKMIDIINNGDSDISALPTISKKDLSFTPFKFEFSGVVSLPITVALVINSFNMNISTGLAMTMLVLAIGFLLASVSAIPGSFPYKFTSNIDMLKVKELTERPSSSSQPHQIQALKSTLVGNGKTPEIAVGASNEPANEQAWLTRTKALYQTIHNNWLEYELNLTKALQYPSMLDMTLPSTANFYKLKNQVERMLSDTDADIVRNKESNDKLVSDLEIAFLQAEQVATKNKIGNYTLEDQKKLQDALPIAELTQSATATPEEKATATKALLKKIEGVVVLPKATQDLLQKNLITSS